MVVLLVLGPLLWFMEQANQPACDAPHVLPEAVAYCAAQLPKSGQ